MKATSKTETTVTVELPENVAAWLTRFLIEPQKLEEMPDTEFDIERTYRTELVTVLKDALDYKQPIKYPPNVRSNLDNAFKRNKPF